MYHNYPYTDFHEANMDWFLNKFKSLLAEWEDMKVEFNNLQEAFAALKAWVEEYFDNLDVQEEINNKLDAMAADGTLGVVLDPYVKTYTEGWLADHITQETGYVLDNTLTIQGAAADAEAVGLKCLNYKGGMLAGADLNDLQVQTIWFRETQTAVVNAPIDDPGIVVTLGAYADMAHVQYYIDVNNDTTYYRYFYNATSGWNDWQIRSSQDDMRFLGFATNGDDANNYESNTIWFCRQNYVSNLPTNVASFVETIGTATGFAYQTCYDYNGNYWFRYRTNQGTWQNWVTPSVQYRGDLADGVDLDTLETQTIWLRATNRENPNAPVSEAGVVYTYGNKANVTSLVAIQKYEVLTTGIVYYRNRTYQGVWSDWISGGGSDYSSKNPNAKMRSITNSILTGSVWTNGSFDHICGPNNAPYMITANALNVERANVNHTLLDGAGMLHDGSANTNFLDTILAENFAGYDVLLTHFYTYDMDEYDVGTVNASANDGTLAGAVVAMCKRVAQSSRSKCQIILASVVPVSYTHYGNNVFTDPYANGKTINELDTVMLALAEKYHFKYITWKDMALSYHWQENTDGNNVHANGEKSYRTLGSYLAGHASSYITF